MGSATGPFGSVDRRPLSSCNQYGLINRIVSRDRLVAGPDELVAKDLDFESALEYLHAQVTLGTLTEVSAQAGPPSSRKGRRGSLGAESC